MQLLCRPVLMASENATVYISLTVHSHCGVLHKLTVTDLLTSPHGQMPTSFFLQLLLFACFYIMVGCDIHIVSKKHDI